MSNLVFDAYAWLEYLDGSKDGGRVNELINNSENTVFTNNVTFAEVISVAKRRRSNVEIAARAILSLSQVYEGDLEFYKDVGLLHAELRQNIPRFGLADAFVLLTARKLGAKVVTGDPHFKGLKGVVFI